MWKIRARYNLNKPYNYWDHTEQCSSASEKWLGHWSKWHNHILQKVIWWTRYTCWLMMTHINFMVWVGVSLKIVNFLWTYVRSGGTGQMLQISVPIRQDLRISEVCPGSWAVPLMLSFFTGTVWWLSDRYRSNRCNNRSSHNTVDTIIIRLQHIDVKQTFLFLFFQSWIWIPQFD